jgi:Fur family transcriptional regulator, zinc uptake regulator
MLNKIHISNDQNNNYSKQSSTSKAFRLTTNQRMVYDTLLNLRRSAGAYELLDLLKKKGINAAATIYRALNELKSKGLVQRIVSTRTFIALQNPKPNNDDSIMIICQHCGEVFSIQDNKIAEVLDNIEKIGYSVSTYHLELIVSCSACSCGEK